MKAELNVNSACIISIARINYTSAFIYRSISVANTHRQTERQTTYKRYCKTDRKQRVNKNSVFSVCVTKFFDF